MIGGLAVDELARTYGTPLYVLDHQTMQNRITGFQQALGQMKTPGSLHYAGKAFLCQAMAGYLADLGVGLDVVSGGELFTALRAGFPGNHMVFHGNVKTRDEIREALRARVGHLVIDSLAEMDVIEEEAGRLGVNVPVLLRITPGIEAHTHAFIRTGQFDSKFGFGLKDGLADEAVTHALSLPHLRLEGFHAHIGSQILEGEPFVANAEALAEYSVRWYRDVAWWPQVLDLGGGFGVRYGPDDVTFEVGEVLARAEAVIRELTPSGQEPPTIMIEPGRSIVAEAGITVYQVEAVKTVAGGKRYVSVDGGMGDNIRPALYQAAYHVEVDGKVGEPGVEAVTVAGRYCESGDVLIAEAHLPHIEVGDHLVVYATGAYNYSMASTYNRVPRPPVVMVREGVAETWVERETYAHLASLDRAWQG